MLFLLIATTYAQAVPAFPGLLKVRQPDGTSLTVRLIGDEFLNFYTTADGFSVVKNATGAFVYASLKDGTLHPTSQMAHNAGERRSAEVAFVRQLPRGLAPTMNAAQQLRKSRALKALATSHYARESHYDYSKFRGLVILVNYTDKKFTYPAAVIDSMINQEGFKGFYSVGETPQWQPCTGSVRDYFEATSAGQFKPHFDVIGPIECGKSSTYVGQTSSAQSLFKAVLDSADAQVDYSRYDTDGDGTVDMVLFLVAGPGSHYNGGNLLWPHASTILNKTLDGVRFGRYACSVELRGIVDLKNYPDLANNPEYQLGLDGPGTICHEFSHVLGLRDEYDTNYASGGKCPHPGYWSVMANGCYLNLSRTPCGYSLLERCQAGFAQPETINASGTYTLQDLMESNRGFRINTLQDKEFFLLENRQQKGWDQYLPGHGMLVFRVDSTNPQVWTNNTVNCYSSHPYYELLRAGGDSINEETYSSASKLIDTDHDPYPGTRQVERLDNTTTPSLKSWAGLENDVALSDIHEDDGVITLKATRTIVPQIVEDFEQVDTVNADTIGVAGNFTTWDFDHTGVSLADSTTQSFISGARAARFYRKGTLTSGLLNYTLTQLKFTVSNPTGAASYFRAFVSTDNGASWTGVKSLLGATNLIVKANNKSTMIFKLGTSVPARIRIEEFTGSTTEPLYVDNIIVQYNSVISTGIKEVSTPTAKRPSEAVYDLQGRKVADRLVKDTQLPKGIYVVDGRKVVVK